MGPPSSNKPATSPMTPNSMTPMDNTSAAFAPINDSECKATESFWFKQKQKEFNLAICAKEVLCKPVPYVHETQATGLQFKSDIYANEVTKLVGFFSNRY
ncbi:hypothetical protein PILCRDRAFT_827599 [Piloderma croceum F 1598]|uniref:Uncharacterized protein n=1 Tax=Piloderma croceum (strain F 1598) TaxID=765440 RepID=A0A0C3ER41_PILCF|nr:hypothetical protein PILCRDRAFT_827599 [Piloderma croceum F 1598]